MSSPTKLNLWCSVIFNLIVTFDVITFDITSATVTYSSSDPEVSVSVLLNTKTNILDERYVSIAVDTSLIADEWPSFDFRSSRLKTLAKALSPGFLRLGGSAADFMLFCHRKQSSKWDCPKFSKEDDVYRRNYSTFYMTDLDFDNINQFASNSGMRLIFDLNSLYRNANNQWNSSNAETLLKYAITKNYSQNLDLELGNEPNAYGHAYHRNVSAKQLGHDFRSLRVLLNSLSPFSRSLLIGPSVTQPKTASLEYLTQFLKSVQWSIDKITVHHYYIDGRKASLAKMMSIKVLNSLVDGLVKLKKVIKSTSYSNISLWLGETGSCWGGGAPGLSDRYVAGFMWLDKLGVAARLGVNVVVRQSFFHGHYALVDNNINPNPDFWLTWLYKRLVGQAVLAVATMNTTALRIYAHCTNTKNSFYPKGSVTLYLLNLSRKNQTLSFDKGLLMSEKHLYWLLPHGSQGLRSSFVSVSGKVLKLVNNFTLPDPVATVFSGGQQLQLPGSSYGFIVVPHANALACLNAPTACSLQSLIADDILHQLNGYYTGEGPNRCDWGPVMNLMGLGVLLGSGALTFTLESLVD